MMRTARLTFVFIATWVFAEAITPAPLTDAENQRIQQYSKIYHLDAALAAASYQALFSDDNIVAGKAAESFENAKAFDILAEALPKIAKPDVRLYAIDVLLQKKSYSSAAFDALLQELDRLNETPPASMNQGTGPERLKARIATVVAKWLAMPQPLIDFASPQAVANFIGEAKSRSAGVSSSPY